MKKNISRSNNNNDLCEVIKEFSFHLSLGLKKNNSKVLVEEVLKQNRHVGDLFKNLQLTE